MGLALSQRVLLSLAFILPLGLAMGLPLPLAVAEMNQAKGDFVVWAWGINGLASVVGSVLAVIVARSGGYVASFAFGAICYLLAGTVFPRTAADE